MKVYKIYLSFKGRSFVFSFWGGSLVIPALSYKIILFIQYRTQSFVSTKIIVKNTEVAGEKLKNYKEF